jgi:hypothetical protein
MCDKPPLDRHRENHSFRSQEEDIVDRSYQMPLLPSVQRSIVPCLFFSVDNARK